MTRQVEISPVDHTLIIAAITGCVRRMTENSRNTDRDAINFVTASAETISRLNSGRMDNGDVRFINTCIQKTVDLLRTDLPARILLGADQRRLAITQYLELQTKLQGPTLVLDA